jgi:hypothetical protein
MFKKKAIIFIFFIWLIIYSLVSLSQEEGGILGYISVFLVLLLESLGLGGLIMNFRNVLSRKITILVFLWLIYVSCSTILLSSSLKFDLREVIFWPLIFFLFYYLFQNDYKNQLHKFTLKIALSVYILLILIFTYNRFTSGLLLDSSNSIASNYIFYIALFAPLFFLYPEKKLLFLIIGFICVLISLKRSATLFYSMILCMYLYAFYIKGEVKNAPKNVIILFISLIAALGGFFLVEDYTGNKITNRLSSASEDSGSGRFDIFMTVYENFNDNKSFVEKMFGSGHNAVRYEALILEHNVPLSSHNDFLEIVYDYGWIGFVLYLLILRNIYSYVKPLKRLNKGSYYALLASLVLVLLMSMSSHLVIYPTYFSLIILVWCICLTKNQRLKYGQ